MFWLIPAPAPEANFLNWSWLPKRRGGELGGVRELDRLEYPLSPSLAEIFLIEKDILNNAYILFLPEPDSSMIVFRLDWFMHRLNLSLLMAFFLLPAWILTLRLSPLDMIDHQRWSSRKDEVFVEDCWLCCAQRQLSATVESVVKWRRHTERAGRDCWLLRADTTKMVKYKQFQPQKNRRRSSVHHSTQY